MPKVIAVPLYVAALLLMLGVTAWLMHDLAVNWSP